MRNLLVSALAIVIVCPVFSDAGHSEPVQDPYAHAWNRENIANVRGEVMFMEPFRIEHGEYGRVHIMTPYGPETIVLAPRFVIERERISFRRGDLVEVVGSRTTIDGQRVILARQVGHSTRTYVFRNEMGQPLWAATRMEVDVQRGAIMPVTAVTFGAGRRAEERASTLRPLNRSEVERMITNWPAKNREVATTMMNKYGPPHEATPMRLVWWDNGPWKFSMLVNHEIPHRFPMEHADMLYQAVNFDVPVDKYTDLVRYDGSLIIERTRGTLGARCDKEEANFLAVNLAHDIINNRRTVEQARDFYAQAITAMMNNTLNAEQRRYLNGLTFEPSSTPRGDPDRPHPGGSGSGR